MILAFIGVAVAVAAAAVEVSWDPPKSTDGVRSTVLQVMEVGSSNVTTFATSATSIVIPGNASGRLFRIAHSNDVGLGDWTPWSAPPGAATGLKVIVPLVP